jgi:hypothetical protein
LIAKLNAQVLPVVFLLFFFDGKNKKKYWKISIKLKK